MSANNEVLRGMLKRLILNAPPGQLTKVVDDCELLDTSPDLITEELLSTSFEEYSEAEGAIQSTLDGSIRVLVCAAGKVGVNRYLIPRMKQVATVDLRKQQLMLPLQAADEHYTECEAYRAELEKLFIQFENYNIPNHWRYKDAMLSSPFILQTSIYGKKLDDTICKIVAVRTSENISLRNFWSGASNSTWEVTFTPSLDEGILQGRVKTRIHQFEQGNSQVIQERCIEEKLKNISDPTQFARCVYKRIGEIEELLFDTFDDALQTIGSTALRMLRRISPLSKRPFSWDIEGLRLRNELASLQP